MTRNEALEIAKANREAHMNANMAMWSGKGPKVTDADFNCRHGWYSVGEFSFGTADLTGEQYDADQAGWAWL